MIADQSIVTYSGTWKAPAGLDNGTVVNDVLNALVSDGIVSRASPVISGASDFNPLGGTFTVKLILQVENGLGFANPDDFISIIRHEVLQEVGEYPSSDSVPQVQVPGRTPVPTGQPGASAGTPPPSGCISGSSSDLTGSFSLSCWFSNLTGKGLSTVGILALIALAAFGLIIFYGPSRSQ
jgi:hypothetical protein